MILARCSRMAVRCIAFAGVALGVSAGFSYAKSQLEVAISQSFSTVVSQLSVGKNVGLREAASRKAIKKAIQADQANED